VAGGEVRLGLARLCAAIGRRGLFVGFELAFAAAVLVSVLPLFATRYLPIQDLPQHVAAVRVLFDYRDPNLGFERFFERSFTSTQYLGVYLLSGALMPLLGAVVAVKVVLAASVAALPYALRAVLRELHRPESYALLAVPLAYNAHLILGFVNFLAALPLLFAGVALALRLRRRFTHGCAWALGLVALACFYTHVVPYGVLLAACCAVLLRRDLAEAARSLVALAPSVAASALWLGANPAGRALAALAVGAPETNAAVYLSAADALRELPEWFTDVFRSSDDERAWLVWITTLVALYAVGAATPRILPVSVGAARRRLAWFVPALVGAYWVMPESYGFIWPIHGRFPLLAALFAIVIAPRVARPTRAGVVAVALLLSGWTSATAWRAFRGAARESDGLAVVLGRIPEGSRVAGLVYARSSSFVRYSPYLHAVAWVQAERGGAVQFTFADFPHSPFRFRESNRPPGVPPRWEWLPERVGPQRDLAWFEYVLTRGGPPLFGFRLVTQQGMWALWRRD